MSHHADSVLAAAYATTPRATLLHIVRDADHAVLCGRVDADALAGEYPLLPPEAATCQVCLRRYRREIGS